MGRMMRILIGAGLIGYGVYSGNAWFYLGIMPLITGIINWCPMEKMMGKCSDESCSSGSCETSAPKGEETACCSSEPSNKEETSCCSVDTQNATFSAIKPEEKTACCSNGSDKIVIKILGTGCAKCVALKKIVDEAIKSIDKECEVIKVEDVQEIMKYQVMSTPGLVINEEVKSAGKLLNQEEIIALIKI